MTRTHSILILVALAACSRKPEPEKQTAPWASAPTAAPVSPHGAAATAPTTTAPPQPDEKIVWNAPPNWQRLHSNSQVRKAWYRIPPVTEGEKDAADLMVYYFGQNQGGDSEANIQRWIGQFPDAKPNSVKRGQRTANGLKQTTVEVEGTYTTGPMSPNAQAPTTNYALIAAVVETPIGSYFFKLTGPKKEVDIARKDFYAMLESVRQS
jgi:hypothetical protein